MRGCWERWLLGLEDLFCLRLFNLQGNRNLFLADGSVGGNGLGIPRRRRKERPENADYLWFLARACPATEKLPLCFLAQIQIYFGAL